MGRFVIQNNLIAENDLRQMQDACVKHNIPFEDVKVIPFSEELPEFTVHEDNVYYGSTTFISNVFKQLKPKGVFFDPETFLMSNYINQWGECMLNFGSEITTIPEFIRNAEKLNKFSDEDNIFIRPNADDKSFDGQVMTFGHLKDWKKNLTQYDNTESLLTAKVLVGEPFLIRKEWRTFIVNGQIVSASLYREEFRLKKSATDIPPSMLDYVRQQIKKYQPAKAFAMDVGLSGTDYYIIECGCINSVGFYHADIERIVLALAGAV